MLKNKEKLNWVKRALLCLLLIAVAIPTANTLAETNSTKSWLKTTITYCDKLDKSEYTTKSWSAFQKELKKAKAVYKKKKLQNSNYTEEREKLEAAKADLMFISVEDKGNPLAYRQLSVNDMVYDMGAGWNLGNAMDGHTSFNPNETLWQSVVTSKALIKKVHDMGFNTVRIPVTWGKKINGDYSIDEAWMSRVQDIVDYCISQNMYCILTVFHDGAEQAGWIHIAADDIDPVYEKYEHVWRTIATRFKDYDEHLVFEGMNEITGGNKSTPDRDIKIIMNLDQIFVNVVRSTGSNNSQRWLSVPGRYTNIDTTSSEELGFKIPEDTVKNRIFVSVHDYNYGFGLVESQGNTEFGYLDVKDLATRCEGLVKKFTSKGVPVILGEYGAINKNNTPERAYYYEAFTRICALDGIVPCVWDSGDYDPDKKPADYSFSLVDRATLKEVYPEIVNAVMRGRWLKSTLDDLSDIIKNPLVTKISDIALSDASVSMTIGDIKKITATVSPNATNDTIVWKSDDANIATVYNGSIRARGIGTTKLTVASRSGSIEKTITVTVAAKKVESPCTSIITSNDNYSLVKGKNINLGVSLQPAGTDDYATYKSSDDSIATVNSFGKVVACSKGSAIITITTASGLTKTVKVDVTLDQLSSELKLGINVYYNDTKLNYWGNELGNIITVTKEGQYTLTFDCSKNLSKEAIKAGITGLNNIGAIYIKDYNVDTGKILKSPVKSCDIMFNKIIVDGKEMTITQKSPKSALKASGIFDTNDPVNAYDGSSIAEVEEKVNDSLNFTTVHNPQKITVTFTLSNLVFDE